MKTVILRSRASGEEIDPDEKYLQKLDTRYAERVIGNLQNNAGFCTACGPDCNNCREAYDLSRGTDIAAVIDFPDVLPYVIEQPDRFVPQDVPEHDVLLAICIHEQILLAITGACAAWGTKGIVVPLEASDWVSGATRDKVHRVCEKQGIEVAFPKPFCAFKPPRESVLEAFMRHFRIGCPDVALTIEGGRITKAHVEVSAACGATYCVARWLDGRRMDENLEIEVVSKWWHSFPCTASMERDPELHDETALHVAGQAHYAILAPHKRVGGLETGMVVSPLGTTVQKPVPPRENLARIQRAKDMILAEAGRRGSVSLRQLMRSQDPNPAAVNSAILLLKKEGKIRSDGVGIYPVG